MDSEILSFMLGAVARLTISVILGLAAIHSMREWAIFSAVVEQYRIGPRSMSRVASWVLPPLELVAAVALVLPATSFPGALLALGLMLLFTASIGINLARGRTYIDCGCGGATGQKLSRGLVIRNLVIVFGLAIAAAAPATGAVDAATTVCVIGASLALIALYFAANQLMTNLQALGALGSRS
jgi:hypothetical protein